MMFDAEELSMEMEMEMEMEKIRGVGCAEGGFFP